MLLYNTSCNGYLWYLQVFLSQLAVQADLSESNIRLFNDNKISRKVTILFTF